MSRINELTQDQEEILNLLFVLDDSDEEDQEQIEYLNKKLNMIRGSAESTILFLNSIWLELRAIAEKRKEAKQRAERRQKTAENAEKRLKNRIIEIMETFDIQKVVDDSTGEGIRTQMSPGTLVFGNDFDYSTLPQECRKEVPAQIVPIDAEIKKLLKNGFAFDGIELVKSLGIRVV